MGKIQGSQNSYIYRESTDALRHSNQCLMRICMRICINCMLQPMHQHNIAGSSSLDSQVQNLTLYLTKNLRQTSNRHSSWHYDIHFNPYWTKAQTIYIYIVLSATCGQTSIHGVFIWSENWKHNHTRILGANCGNEYIGLKLLWWDAYYVIVSKYCLEMMM